MSDYRKILMITNSFPPHRGGGTLRVLKFAKYLPEFRWKPIVVTLKEKYFINRDDSLIEQIQVGTTIYRTNLCSLNHYIFKILKKLSTQQLIEKSENNHYHPKKNLFKKLLIKGVDFLRKNNILLLPDNMILWTPYVLKLLLLKDIRTVSAIYSTCPSPSVIVIGHIISKILKVPHIIDLRDAWTENPLVAPKGKIRLEVENILEKHIFNSASYIVCVTEQMKSDYIHKYPNLKEKFVVITNGFDEDDFKNIIPKTLPKISLVYTGSLDERRNPYFLFKSVKELIDEKKVSEDNIYIYIVGSFNKKIIRIVDEMHLKNVIRFVGKVSHKESLQFQKGADVLLLIGTGEASEMTSKIFEYLAVKRFIFAITSKDGAISQLLESEKCGIVAEHNNIQDIKNKILSIYNGDIPLSVHINNFQLNKFSRKYLTYNLAILLNQITK